MPKIKIIDLPQGEKIHQDEMRRIMGGMIYFNPQDRFSGQLYPRSFSYLGPQPEPPDKPYPSCF